MEKPKEERTGALTRKQIQQIKAKLRQFIANADYEGFKSALAWISTEHQSPKK